jgi:P27 family predicted phage terminase small subunit
MGRGRRPLPDEVKAAKGNPGKRRLVLSPPLPGEELKVKPPAFLTTAEEREIFRRIAEQLAQLRFIRATDVAALGRWATYLARWAKCKRALGRKQLYYETKSKHGTMLRIHPLFAASVQLERLMVPLEDRLGLNVQARQMIVRGIFQAPRPHDDEGLFGVKGQGEGEGGTLPASGDQAGAAGPGGPLGFLNHSTDTKH